MVGLLCSDMCDCDKTFGLGIKMPFLPALKFPPLVAWQNCWQRKTSVIAFHWAKWVEFGFVFLLALLELQMEWSPPGQQVKRVVHPEKNRYF